MSQREGHCRKLKAGLQCVGLELLISGGEFIDYSTLLPESERASAIEEKYS